MVSLMVGDVNADNIAMLPRNLDLVGMPAALLNPELRIIEANNSLAVLLGTSANDLIGRPFTKQMAASAKSVPGAGGTKIFQFRIGDRECCYRLDRYPHGSQTIAMLIDITRDLAPQAIAREEARSFAGRLSLALKAANAAVLEYDYRKKRYWASDELAAMIGVSEVKIKAYPPKELFVEEDHHLFHARAKDIQSGAPICWADARLITVNGPRWTRLYLEVERNQDGKPIRALGLYLDIEEQKRQEIALTEARRAAEAAAKAKSHFLASMSHEIRTPLNGVLGMAQALHNEPLTEDQLEQVEIILDSGKTLMALLNDVLDLSKIEAGKLEIVRVEENLRENLERTMRLFHPGAADNGIRLQADLDSSLPNRLIYDPVRVRQCVSNLLSNAIKFTERGGAVELIVESEPRSNGSYFIAITVSDTGIGMSRETLGKLFTAFAQADGLISRRFGGTGLGLAISRSLARQMGGDIFVESELGVGSRFRFTFKAECPAPAQIAPASMIVTSGCEPSAEAPESNALEGARVLLVDDNPVNRRVIRLFLEPCDLKICEAEDGQQALEALQRETFDIVLLDVHMPVMDGCETIKAIRSSGAPWQDLPVIALTADALSGDKERILSMGMSNYLAKPIDKRELISTMSVALSRGAAAADELDVTPLHSALAALEDADLQTDKKDPETAQEETSPDDEKLCAPSPDPIFFKRLWQRRNARS